MEKENIETEVYPENGSALEKISFLDRNEFKTIWKLNEMKNAIKSRNDSDLINNLKEILKNLSDEGGVFMLNFRNSDAERFYTTDFVWEKDEGVFTVIVKKPVHPDFVKIINSRKIKSYDFSSPTSTSVEPNIIYTKRCILMG